MAKKNHSLQVVVGIGLILTAGCDWLRPGGPPDEAQVEISSADVNQLTVVVSQHFERFQEPVCAGDPECPTIERVISADTLVVSSPYSNVFDFTDRYQIIIETFPADDVQAVVQMNVDIDGKEWFDVVRLLDPMTEDGQRDRLRFVYQYNDLQAQNSGGP
jgi:hypothetical protein